MPLKTSVEQEKKTSEKAIRRDENVLNKERGGRRDSMRTANAVRCRDTQVWCPRGYRHEARISEDGEYLVVEHGLVDDLRDVYCRSLKYSQNIRRQLMTVAVPYENG